MTTWDVTAANDALRMHFAAWVRSLDLVVEATDDGTAVLRMRFHDALCRQGGIVSGQALAALADTAMVFAIASKAGAFRPMATVDLHATFMRAVSDADVIAEAVVERLGRTLAFARVAMWAVEPGVAVGERGSTVASGVGTFAVG